MILCQQVPADLEEKLRAVHAFTSESISEDLVSPDLLTSMVEVLPSSDMLTSHTVSKKGASVNLKTMGHKKTNFTINLSCTMSGIKHPWMVVFNRKTPDSSVVRVLDLWSKGSCRNGRIIFVFRFNFLCWLLFWYLFYCCVTTVAHKRSWSFCQKCK